VTRFRVVAVGGDPSFRPFVARAIGAPSDAIGWVASVETARESIRKSREPVDLIVLAPAVHEEEAVAIAQFLAREAPTTAIVLVRDVPLNGSFPKLVRAGIRDVVDLTRGTADLEEALHRALDWSSGLRSVSETNGKETAERGRLISIFSTKGGTGKTFLACNLAAAIADRAKHAIGLLDLDHDLGDVFAYFATEPRRSLHDLVTLDEGADAEAVLELGTPLPGNVVGFGSPPDPRAAPLPTASTTRTLRALREVFPFTVIDATTDYSDHVLAALDVSDIIVLVAALDVIGIRHLSLGLQTLESLGIPRDRFRIALNRADSRVDLTPEEIQHLLGLRVDGRIPSSVLVPKSINHGRLLILEEPRSDVARSITQFADLLYMQLTPSAPALQEGKRRLLTRKG
jgi:pilus assembly protein CpaE